MKNLKRNAFFGLLTVIGGVLLVLSCQKENLNREAETVVSTKTTTGGGATSCTVSCFWGTATANCPSGGATCYCSWGSPVTSCGGGSTVAGSFNQAGVMEFEEFVNQNQMNPILIESVHQLQNGFNSGDWGMYLQAQENYVNRISEQPQGHQEMIEMWLNN